MRAIVHTRYGPPEVAQLKEVAKPKPKDNEVLIKIQATTVNRTDSALRSAAYFINRLISGLFGPRNKILGNEFAGDIEAIGKNVTLFTPGEKVFGYNDKTFGAHAEYMTLAETGALATMPANFTYAESAPICEGAHYALCDIRAAKVKSGQRVLVNGATGAIGSAAVQLLKYFRAHITAVCDTKHIRLVQSLGADTVIDYTQTDFTTMDHRFDFIYDAVGKSSFGKCKPLLTPRGIYKSTELGNNSENIFLALSTPLRGGKKVLFPIPTINKEDVIFLKGLAERGEFKPVVDRHYALEQIVEAYRYVETGQKIGNVVIALS